MTELNEYQREYVNAILELMGQGEKRISVLMPVGTGRTSVIFGTINQMNDGCVLIISDRKEVNGFIEQAAKDNDVKCDAYCITSIIGDTNNNSTIDTYNLVFLYDLRPYSRELLLKNNPFTDSTIIVSVGSAQFSIQSGDLSDDELFESINNLAQAMFKSSTFTPLVYKTKTVLDIRDLDSAEPDERIQLLKDLRKKRKEIVHGIAEFHNTFESNKEKQKLKELEELNAYLQRKLEFDEKLLTAVGINIDKVNSSFERIERLRSKLEDRFYLADGSIDESVIAQFEGEVAREVVQLTKQTLTIETKERYEDILKGYLTNKVWEMLSSDSRLYLVSSKMSYEAMTKMENCSELDFSGVCLQITKTLDEEMTERLYSRYTRWLREKYNPDYDIYSWPRALIKENRKTGEYEVIPENEFTLGTIKHVLGVDDSGNIKNNYTFSLFKRFAKQELYISGLSDNQIENNIKNIGLYVEKVRTTYRNPAAHRHSLDVISAEACMGYMIETYKKLKEMLQDMKS